MQRLRQLPAPLTQARVRGMRRRLHLRWRWCRRQRRQSLREAAAAISRLVWRQLWNPCMRPRHCPGRLNRGHGQQRGR